MVINNEPVTWVIDPLWNIADDEIWSSPCPTVKKLFNTPTSLPTPDVLRGPDIIKPPSYEDPDGLEYTHLFFCESHNIEPVDSLPNDPVSTTCIPPNLIDGLLVFNVIKLLPVLTDEPVTVTNDAVPITVKSPYMVWLPEKLLEPVVAKLPDNLVNVGSVSA